MGKLSEKTFNHRMPKCNTVLQSENGLFEPEIQPNSLGNCLFFALVRTIKSSKCFGHCPVKEQQKIIHIEYYRLNRITASYTPNNKVKTLPKNTLYEFN